MNEDNFKWNDSLVKSFLSYYIMSGNEYRDIDMAIFKEHNAPKKEYAGRERDWEIMAFAYNIENATLIIPKVAGGLFHCGFEQVTESYCFLNKYDIHSVRRLKNNTVWTVGDKYNILSEFAWQIREFHIGIRDDSQLYVKDISGHETSNINLIQKPYTKQINPTGYVIQSNNGFEYPGFDIAWMGSVGDKRTNYKYDEMFFESKENAEDFLMMNTPCLNALEIEILLEKHLDGIRLEQISIELEDIAKSKLS